MGRRSKNKQAPPQPLREDQPLSKGKRKAQESTTPAKKVKTSTTAAEAAPSRVTNGGGG
uniref:Probable nop2-nucleolar protein n=1 Tax=Melanopsichium pennsylvanicum 4 TaxID=1398559 RepID=A0A077R0D9_9BASI|nr:probable nop2-nucleolar protein [Melanopsichium pennsylvanicum 4]